MNQCLCECVCLCVCLRSVACYETVTDESRNPQSLIVISALIPLTNNWIEYFNWCDSLWFFLFTATERGQWHRADAYVLVNGFNDGDLGLVMNGICPAAILNLGAELNVSLYLLEWPGESVLTSIGHRSGWDSVGFLSISMLLSILLIGPEFSISSLLCWRKRFLRMVWKKAPCF